MKTIMKISGVMAAVMFSSSIAMAVPHYSRGDYRGRDGGYSHGYRPSYSCGSSRGSYYSHGHVNLASGLLGLAVVATVASAASRSETVYVQREVVYAPPPAQVVYVTPAPRVDYVQQQTVVVQQPVAYEPPQPLTMVINVQNSNGSMTPVTLRQVGVQWVGPRGEYYDNLPTVGQLRTVYGF